MRLANGSGDLDDLVTLGITGAGLGAGGLPGKGKGVDPKTGIDPVNFPDGISFNPNQKKHLTTFDGFSQKKGVNGTHNLDAFNQAVANHNLKIVSKTNDPNVEGIIQIKYQIPRLDKQGNPTGSFKKPMTKTVYDPKVISNAQILTLGQQAAAAGLADAIAKGKKHFSAMAGGVNFRVYIRNGAIDNFHPEYIP